MKPEITSEEKLLNLIRKKPMPNQQVPRVKKAHTAEKRAQISPSRRQDAVDLLNLGLRFLLFFATILLGYLAINIFIIKDNRHIHITSAQDNGEPLPTPTPAGDINSSILSFNTYAEIINKRDIFTSTPKPQSINPETKTPQEKIDINLSTDFKLVGIILDKNPQAVIEDIKNKKTLFVSPGELVGEAVLEKVMHGKVILDYHNQKIELIP